MDTRALKNPYHDYDANPAMTRELFDPHGRVREDDGLVGGAHKTSALMQISPPPPVSFSSRQSFRSGCAAKSTNFFQ